MGLSKQGHFVYCSGCGSRQKKNGVCKICAHVDNPLLPGMVPNIVGNALSTGKSKITHAEAQLVVGDITEENSPTVVAGKIISSDPAADTKVGIGSAVDIVVSLGPSA